VPLVTVPERAPRRPRIWPALAVAAALLVLVASIALAFGLRGVKKVPPDGPQRADLGAPRPAPASKDREDEKATKDRKTPPKTEDQKTETKEERPPKTDPKTPPAKTEEPEVRQPDKQPTRKRTQQPSGGGRVSRSAIDEAVEEGVAALKKMQRQDGTWPSEPYDKIGATALAGLTLLECGVKADDKAVKDAAQTCRKVALTTLYTYSLSLIVLFLDRLDRPEDAPLIEAMIVNLLAGQNGAGGWDYTCIQAFNEQEMRAITAESGDSERKLKTTRDWKKMPAKGKRVATELPASVQAKLVMIAKGAPT
jgi:hypothetical protein